LDRVGLLKGLFLMSSTGRSGGQICTGNVSAQRRRVSRSLAKILPGARNDLEMPVRADLL
jgi:hypothetical protein